MHRNVQSDTDGRNDRTIMAVAWALLGASLVIGVLTRFLSLLHYVNFEADQARDAYVFTAMRHHVWPTLGPDIWGYFFHLPPLYYYFVFPIRIFGPAPTLQVLPNAVFSFLTIPLVMFALYRLLENISYSRRLFLSAIGGLWWSVMAADINIATREWNPSTIPFFVTAFALIAAAEIRHPGFNRVAFIRWSALGALFALLLSLSGSTLYVMPVFFGIISVIFVARCVLKSSPRAVLFVAWSLLVATICMAPYWHGERREHWRNSREIVSYAHAESEKRPALEKVENALRAYGWLDGQGYFLGGSLLFRKLGLLFLIVIIPTAVMTFRGNRVLFGMLACLWFVYLCAASSHPAIYVHYRLPLILAPIFLCISSLAYLHYSNVIGRLIGALLIVGVIVSIGSNMLMDIKHGEYFFGSSRLVAVSDIEGLFKTLPYGVSICDKQLGDRYIDEFITRRGLIFSETCAPGMYEIVPNFVGTNVTGSDFQTNSNSYNFAYLESADLLPIQEERPGFQAIAQGGALTLFKDVSGGVASPLR